MSEAIKNYKVGKSIVEKLKSGELKIASWSYICASENFTNEDLQKAKKIYKDVHNTKLRTYVIDDNRCLHIFAALEYLCFTCVDFDYTLSSKIVKVKKGKTTVKKNKQIVKFNVKKFLKMEALNKKKENIIKEEIKKVNITSDMSELEKVSCIENYIINTYTYDIKLSRENDITKVINLHKGVCRHFSILLQKMCLYYGVDCKCAGGYAYKDKNNNHIWNKVKIDGEWYWYDLTWELNEFAHGEKNFSKVKLDDKNFIDTHTVEAIFYA